MKTMQNILKVLAKGIILGMKTKMETILLNYK